MKFYELTLLIYPDLSEEELSTFSQRTGDFILGEGGTLNEMTFPTIKKLGCPIKNKRSAYSIVVSFRLSPDKLEKLEKNLKAESSILRFIISTKKILKAAKAPRKPKIIKEVGKLPSFSPANLFTEARRTKMEDSAKEGKKEQKVELKEIEKKLEEILGQ